YFFYTAASGGTGLSLPHKDNRCRPRRLWTGPIYSGKVFIQLMGRPHRRNSISDTHARIGLMNRTIESAHVAPILDNKLRAAAKMATKKFDISSIFEDPDLMKKLEFEDSSQLIR